MKKFAFIILAALTLTSCWTRIWTVAPTDEVVVPVKTVYTTEVTTPTPKHTTVTTITVTSYNTDLSFYLDLNAVAAAFAEARNVSEFERILNSSKYMINNLDLNRDGWIDYLRVLEVYGGVYHTFLIQACLGPSMYQDVATLIAERRPTTLVVEVIGDRWLYGPNYIVRPVFIKRPPIWDVFGRSSYAAWSSPYYYDHWPNYYQKPKPVYLNHYQAYVNTYLSNHTYCHKCDYPTSPFYTGYTQDTRLHSHTDYATQHPDNSFEHRVTQPLAANGGGVTARNAGELRTETQREATRTSVTTSGAASRTSSTSSSSSRTSSSSTSTGGVTTRTSSSATTSTATAATRQPSTSVDSRVNKSGTTRTTIKTTDENGRTQTVQRTSSTTSTSRSGSAVQSGTSVRSSRGTTIESSPRSTQRAR